MKAHLTENGVLTLYNHNSQTSVKAQVLYMTHWNLVSFIRVTDSKHLSPIMAIMKMTEKFIVGDIILIKKVQLQPPSMFKDEDILHIIDSDLNHMVILEYQVVEKKGKIGILFSLSNANCVETSYWNSLSLIKNSLIKGDSLAQSFFKEGEKRLQLLRPDCNLLRERGNELFKKQNFCKAILHYDMAKQKDHYDARVWNNSSQAYFSNNEYDKARRDALVALKLDPFNKKAYYRAGRAMEKAGDINGALEIIEAGLYVCGKCEDMEKLLQQIKDSSKLINKGKKEEIQSTNIPQNKKKINNGEVVGEGPDEPPLANGNKKNLKPKDSPQKKIRDIESVKAEASHKAVNINEKTQDTLKNTKIRTLSFLVGAKMLFEKGKYKNALELYEAATALLINNNIRKETEVVKYLIDICKIKLKVDSIEVVKNNLMHILSKDTFPFPPAIHYWLANIYEILEDQDKVIYHANACLHMLENNSTHYALFWPGTTDLISETSPEELKKWFIVGTWRSAPLAKCRHIDCISIQNFSLAKPEIYTSDLDFRGYVEVECEELCSICYHPCCWKSRKEQSEDGQPGRKTDKEFLGLQCFTPDCSGKISSIRIFDETCKLRNEFAKVKREKNTSSSKPKKKKDKKKLGNIANKQEDKKKIKGNEFEDTKLEIDVEIVKEETATKKPTVEKPTHTQLDQKNFEGNNFKVLKPSIDLDDYVPQPTKKNKAKKKKGKQVTQLIIGDDVEDRFVHNEYLTRLRALKAQREALESDIVHNQSSSEVGRFKYLPECVLDPEKPFYLPQHLQENPAQLESILRAKMATFSSSDIDKEVIAILLEFMYDWLKAQSPMLVSDPRIKECISENFPHNAVTYVNNCGGIRHFLLQSFRFALIDEVICVNEQVVSAQEAAIHIVLEKFKLTKFLISDGYKAVKFSHLLDDTKSTCSSNSSLSGTRLASAAVTSIPSAPCASISSNSSPQSYIPSSSIPSAAVPSPPSYKNVAMGKISQPTQKEEQHNYETLKMDSTLQEIKQDKSPVAKSPINKVPKKQKLKTMDMDAFEVTALEMGQLFSTNSTGNFDKPLVPVTKGGLLFQSDDETENDTTPVPISNQPKESQVAELKEKIAILESELAAKEELLSRTNSEKDLLVSQNQELSNRFSQIKVKSNLEIDTWKKSSEDAQEQIKMAKSNLECFRTQKEGELRKLLGEKSRFQEDLKAYTTKLDSLQLTNDQIKASKAQLEEEVNQKCIELTEMQTHMIKLQSSAKVLDERAMDAESKYLSMKRDLIKLSLEKTKKRLTAEVNKMHELHLEATEDTHPSKSLLTHSINEWEETITKLNNHLQSVVEEGQKLLDYIRVGRALNTLPPGDLQIPSVPDLTVAHLLFVGRPIQGDSKGTLEKMNSLTSSCVGFMGLGDPFYSSPSSNPAPQPPFGGLTSGGIFSLGQLGVTPSHQPANIGSSHFDKPPLQDSPLMVGTSSLSSHRSILPPSRLGGVSMGLGGMVGHGASRFSENSSGFSINGVNSSVNQTLSNLIGENLSKGGSSNSSPISVPLSPMTSFSGSSDFTPTYSVGSKTPNSESNQIFVGQLPWDFTESHLKAVFCKYGVVAAVLHDKGNTSDGKPVPKCGFVTFRSQQERDRALKAGPINFGNHTLNIQAKEVKRAPKNIPPPPQPLLGPIPSPPSSVLGPVPDLPLIPPSSISSLNHPIISEVSASANKSLGGGSAFGLQSLLEANSRSEPRTVATPTTPTATKPKFQNLRTNTSMGAIGTLPPKVVRPIPRPGNTVVGAIPSLLAVKEETMVTSNAYKKLVEACKQKLGNEYPVIYINKAIKEVREQNRNSLSGLTLDAILEQVESQLRMRKKAPVTIPPKLSVAPWAQMSQVEAQWQSASRKFDNIPEDQCAICLEMLSSSNTTRLPCEHVFHVNCINNWLVLKSDCPMCRKFALNIDEYPSLSHG